MRWRFPLLATLASVASISACANDAWLLYDAGEVGGEAPPPMTSGGAGSGAFGGMVFATGSGGDEPPPPLECPPRGQPVCECDAFDYCFCAPPPEEDHCTMFCSDGFCGMDCGFATACDMFCEVGCELFCPPESNCMVTCGEDCNVVCAPGSTCFVESIDGPTTVHCEEGAICDCLDPETCFCEGPGCPPTMGP